MDLIIAVVVAVLIALGVVTLAIRWLWRKGRVGKIAALALGAAIVFKVVTAIYPLESFYRAEFEQVTGLPFPASGRFLFKEASFPDHFGDYTACALIEVSTDDYNRLLERARTGGHKTSSISSYCWTEIERRISGSRIAAETSAENVHRSDEYTYWAVLGDRHQVAIHRVTW